MNYKHLFLVLLAMSLLISPVFAFWHPPPPDIPCPTFAVKIRGVFAYSWAYAHNFTEPEDGFCDTFEVEVWALNMTDLYGYEFVLTWDTTYFALKSWVVHKIWDKQLIVFNGTIAANAFKAVAAALAPSVGLNGDVKLATFTFHICNDVCWPQCMVDGVFDLVHDSLKASDSCTEPIPLCWELDGYWKFWAAEPEVYIEPEEAINCVVGEKVTYSVVIYNITKMKSLYLDIRWSGNYIGPEGVWLPILNLTKKDVVINDAVFPIDEMVAPPTITVWNDGLNITFGVIISFEMKCTFPLVNGTEVKAVDLTFTKMDPWWCGRQPNYTKTDHVWTPLNATTDIVITRGWIDVYCPWLRYIDFGDSPDMTQPHGNWFASYRNAKFVFMPVPGDLTGDGKVDELDLTIMAGKYGLYWNPWPGTWAKYWAAWYYDFDRNGIIDIFDIIVITKNFGKECPF